ncbi:MAG: RidA family protein [Patescibacteria group bacterium]
MNTIKIVSTEKAPAVVGPYSQALEVNNFIFCSGQIGIDPKTNTLVEGIEKQTTQVLKNLEIVLLSAGSKLNKVVKTTIYLKSMADYVLVNQIYGSFFKENKPARATVEVSRLPKDALIEIDAIASL